MLKIKKGGAICTTLFLREDEGARTPDLRNHNPTL